VAALQGEAANHRELRRSRAGVVSVAEKACYQRVRCGSRRRAQANHWWSVESVSMASKPGSSRFPGMSLAGACWLARWCPAWRWRERGLGSCVERGNLSLRARGRPVVQPWPAVVRGREISKQQELRGAEYRCGAQGRTVS